MAAKSGVEAFVQLGVVPTMLVIGFIAAGISAGQAYPRARAAAYGGFWTGVLAVAGLVLALLNTRFGPVPFHGLPTTLGEVAAGVGLGSWSSLGYIWFRDRAWIALPLALQAAGSLVLLYLLFVWVDARPHIAWLTAGIAPAATLFYALFRDRPPGRRRRRRDRPQVPARPGLPGETPDAPP